MTVREFCSCVEKKNASIKLDEQTFHSWQASALACCAYLLDHMADFPLLTLQHVIQVMDLLLQRGDLFLQLSTPE